MNNFFFKLQQNSIFQFLVIFIIILNAITLGINTYEINNFIKRIIELLNNKKIIINNIDINIIAQKPKISKYSKKMIKTLSKICKIKINQINIKGKTTEKLGLIGKGKAIASEVISSIIKYD